MACASGDIELIIDKSIGYDVTVCHRGMTKSQATNPAEAWAFMGVAAERSQQ
jgi:hypothetical protein